MNKYELLNWSVVLILLLVSASAIFNYLILSIAMKVLLMIGLGFVYGSLVHKWLSKYTNHWLSQVEARKRQAPKS